VPTMVQTILSGTAIICFVVSAALICVLHSLVRDLNPLEKMVSEYALDPDYGYLMHIAFFVLGFGAILLGGGVGARHLTEGIQSTVLCFAGVGAGSMGVFSMQARKHSELPSPPSEGKIHDWCVMISFTLVLVSMILMACWPVQVVGGRYPWLRGVALVDFNICALTVIFFGILGYTMKRNLPDKTMTSKMQESQASASDPSAVRGYISHRYITAYSGFSNQRGDLKNYGNEAVKTANRGQGMLERILIFMFIGWGLMFSFVVMAPYLVKLWSCIQAW
jgi:hypothetical protein